MPHGDRSNVVIEPYLTDQWYVNAKELAKPAIAAVREGKTKFVPQNWENTYFNWMENIQPWCISRQLWWGHQIPAWYGPDGKVFVEALQRKLRQRQSGTIIAPFEWLSGGNQFERSYRGEDYTAMEIAQGLVTEYHRRRGRARHLVLLGAVAVLDAGLAGQDAGT